MKFMEFVYVIILSLTSALVLFVLTKLMGYRQISEISFFDYVVGITIGSIAAEMATNIDLEWYKGVGAMVVYAVVAILFSKLAEKSIKANRFISGTPIILMEKGKINKTSLAKAKIQINDLLMSARQAGYFDLSDVDYAIMETTGKISFMPMQAKRPLNPQDFNFTSEREGLCVNVILDGKIMKNDLKYADVTEAELEQMVFAQGYKIDDILLGTINLKKELTLYSK